MTAKLCSPCRRDVSHPWLSVLLNCLQSFSNAQKSLQEGERTILFRGGEHEGMGHQSIVAMEKKGKLLTGECIIPHNQSTHEAPSGYCVLGLSLHTLTSLKAQLN